MIRRRAFLSLLGGAAAAWPLAARAQGERVRRIGVLIGLPATEPEAQASLAALRKGLAERGWSEGRNFRIESRHTSNDRELARAAAELVSLMVDVIVARSTPMVHALLRETRTIPIVFTVVAEPVESGFAASFNHPGGNVTGFTTMQPSIGGKWPEILKEIAPSVRRIGVLFNPDTTPRRGMDFLVPISSAARALSLTVVEEPHGAKAELASAVASLAGEPNTGLIALPGLFTTQHHQHIAELANLHRLPSIYPYRYFVTAGGLVSYGAYLVDQFRQAADYVAKILDGAKVSDLPVQQPTKFELVINLKTAKALGLDIPATVLARADEVIE
jgi:putative tryptophan/tyrosine transport system substrate-binding protein